MVNESSWMLRSGEYAFERQAGTYSFTALSGAVGADRTFRTLTTRRSFVEE